MTQQFDIKKYISAYVKQLNFTLNASQNYNIYSNFDAAISILTNTVIYKDLPLNIIEQFENSINWDEERDEEYEQPFITHLNLNSKLFITSFLDSDLNKIDEAAYGIQFMDDLARNHKYVYKIVINKEIPKILNICKRLKISSDNILIVNEESIKTILMINQTYLQNEVIDENENSLENDTSLNDTTTKVRGVEMKVVVDSEIQKENSNKIILREYQKKYIEFMNKNSRSILKLPCGMGKSLIMIYHIMTHGQHSVILVPNVALVDQFYNNIIKVYSSFNSKLPEIHKLSTKDKDFEIIDIQNQQIILSVYNSFVNLFVKPLITKSTSSKSSMESTSTKSLSNIECIPSTATSILEFKSFPYIYIDEAHHIILPSNKRQLANVDYLLELYDSEADTNKSYDTNPDFIDTLYSLPNLSLAFSSLLYIFSQTLCSHSAFFSATINPSNFSLYNMFSAIKDGYLCKLNVDIVIDENYSRTQINKEEKINTFSIYLSKSSYQSIIIYTTRIQTAKDIQKKLPFKTAVITGTMSSSKRQQYFKDFTEHKIRALLTVNCISEGVDLPCADTAVFFDDKKSIINIIQCVGRVMRNYNGKLSSTLVIPAYNDDDIDNIYQNILSIINGELGYGSADIRRSVRIKFNTITKQKRHEIKSKVFHKIYEYNEGYFNKISLNSKLNICSYFYNLKKCIPGLDMSFRDAKLPDGSYFDLQQFVHDNLYLDNEAGKGLRKIYKINLSKESH